MVLKLSLDDEMTSFDVVKNYPKNAYIMVNMHMVEYNANGIHTKQMPKGKLLYVISRDDFQKIGNLLKDVENHYDDIYIFNSFDLEDEDEQVDYSAIPID
ncbi:MAG: hypothetical protein IJ593_10615 [Lachnospiraceae bacterium]|nr:hypothetical protein [Lachnospiraceae bacterium]